MIDEAILRPGRMEVRRKLCVHVVCVCLCARETVHNASYSYLLPSPSLNVTCLFSSCVCVQVHVEIGLPDEHGREQILRIHTADMRANGRMTEAAIEHMPEVGPCHLPCLT